MKTKEEVFEYVDWMLDTYELGYVETLWSVHKAYQDRAFHMLNEAGKELGFDSEEFKQLKEEHEIMHELKDKFFSDYLEKPAE